MGWAKKNEKARLYQLKGPAYILVRESDGVTQHGYSEKLKGTFRGPSLNCFERYRADCWTVERNYRGDALYLCYRGYRQTHTMMGAGTTLCLPEGAVNALEATDEQVIRAYLGDESIYSDGNERLPEDGVDLFAFKGGCPDTWGGSAKRIAWYDLPDWARNDFYQVVANPLKCRGLWRMEDLKNGHAERFCKREQLRLFPAAAIRGK